MKVFRTNDIPWQNALSRGKFENRRKPLGGEKIQPGIWELPPGKRSFPMHAHKVTEEAMYVISGHAKVRTPEGETAIGRGDYVSFPPGGPAHQLVNDGHEPLVYLALGVTQGVDVVEYPESGKLACAVGTFPNGKRFMFRQKDQVDYFDGEE